MHDWFVQKIKKMEINQSINQSINQYIDIKEWGGGLEHSSNSYEVNWKWIRQRCLHGNGWENQRPEEGTQLKLSQREPSNNINSGPQVAVVAALALVASSPAVMAGWGGTARRRRRKEEPGGWICCEMIPTGSIRIQLEYKKSIGDFYSFDGSTSASSSASSLPSCSHHPLLEDAFNRDSSRFNDA